MPSFLIVEQPSRHAKQQQLQGANEINGLLCSPHAATGQPDKSTGVQVRATLVDDCNLKIDNEPRPRQIVSTTGESGVTTYLLSGTTAQVKNRQRRIALQKAGHLLAELNTIAAPLTADSVHPELLNLSLSNLRTWHDEETQSAAE